ncbi:MAG: hypothetical protein AVDCRST_MAG18-468 [uncultured Thermomicrobiales bacterium]|uniref:Uncharacterized protein n=1 Tax=uncultured Thermomicrobiales bacterium TaxID=1645740 RepID=A0A6J4UKE0_9BACT|nr:MAG: hypothetical protein AVDCRST_MAG18-468 [uncultured Thermomicrobiales bacterium]
MYGSERCAVNLRRDRREQGILLVRGRPIRLRIIANIPPYINARPLRTSSVLSALTSNRRLFPPSL